MQICNVLCNNECLPAFRVTLQSDSLQCSECHLFLSVAILNYNTNLKVCRMGGRNSCCCVLGVWCILLRWSVTCLAEFYLRCTVNVRFESLLRKMVNILYSLHQIEIKVAQCYLFRSPRFVSILGEGLIPHWF